MAVRLFNPDEAIILPADDLVGIERTVEGWWIPPAVCRRLARIEMDSLIYMLGRRSGWNAYSAEVDPDRGGVAVWEYQRGDLHYMKPI